MRGLLVPAPFASEFSVPGSAFRLGPEILTASRKFGTPPARAAPRMQSIAGARLRRDRGRGRPGRGGGRFCHATRTPPPDLRAPEAGPRCPAPKSQSRFAKQQRSERAVGGANGCPNQITICRRAVECELPNCSSIARTITALGASRLVSMPPTHGVNKSAGQHWTGVGHVDRSPCGFRPHRSTFDALPPNLFNILRPRHGQCPKSTLGSFWANSQLVAERPLASRFHGTRRAP